MMDDGVVVVVVVVVVVRQHPASKYAPSLGQTHESQVG